MFEPAAKEYINDKKEFKKTAVEYTQEYAMKKKSNMNNNNNDNNNNKDDVDSKEDTKDTN